MKFKNIKQVDTGLSFDVECTNSEVVYLVNFAVERLLQEGVLSLHDTHQTEQEVTLEGATLQ